MHHLHENILEQIRVVAQNPDRSKLSDAYHGTTHPHYYLSNPQLRQIAKGWVKAHQNISVNEYLACLDSLYQGVSYEEKIIGGYLLEYTPRLRKHIAPDMINRWLQYLEGWAEIDSLCQGKLDANNFLESWNEWKATLSQFSDSSSISHRRASLVLLTSPVSQSSDSRLSALALLLITKLMHEKDILITKAISWILRSMIKHHQEEVVQFIKRYKTELPSIAIRETVHKLHTGKK
jgi:3-methyladenine DNA glycosylase AlkD